MNPTTNKVFWDVFSLRSSRFLSESVGGGGARKREGEKSEKIKRDGGGVMHCLLQIKGFKI